MLFFLLFLCFFAFWFWARVVWQFFFLLLFPCVFCFCMFPSFVVQPASRWQMRTFSASRRTAHSVHVHSPSPSNLELPRQTQGAMHCTPNSPKCYAQGTPPKRLRAGRLALMGSHVRTQCREAVHHAVVYPVEPAPGILLQQGVHHMAGLRVQLGGDRLVELLPRGVDRLRSRRRRTQAPRKAHRPHWLDEFHATVRNRPVPELPEAALDDWRVGLGPCQKTMLCWYMLCWYKFWYDVLCWYMLCYMLYNDICYVMYVMTCYIVAETLYDEAHLRRTENDSTNNCVL